jgi:hypothetical protein
MRQPAKELLQKKFKSDTKDEIKKSLHILCIRKVSFTYFESNKNKLKRENFS